jgi:SAM-dependent methyltransferase
MALLYDQDLASIQSAAFGGLARAAAPEIVRLLKTAATPIHRIIDVGCGAGVLTSALVEAGFDVTGVDCSADLLAIAAASVPGARFVNASIYDYAIPGCEAIVAIGEPLTYHDEIADADRRVHDFLQRSAAILPPGGMLIFDVIETGEPSLAGRFWTSGTDWRYNPNAIRYGYTPADVAPHLWGGFAQYVYLPWNAVLHHVPEGVTPELAGLATPMSNGIEWSLFDGGVGYDSTVLIQGPGQQGLSQTVICRQAGASLIIVTAHRAIGRGLKLPKLWAPTT